MTNEYNGTFYSINDLSCYNHMDATLRMNNLYNKLGEQMILALILIIQLIVAIGMTTWLLNLSFRVDRRGRR